MTEAIPNPPKPILRTEDKVMVTTIIPELAAEIGLNESIMLRQLAHWIKTSNNLRDGQWWTYQTLKDMQKEAFPYWSIATISRVAKKLEDAGYIERTTRHNKRRNDVTFWYALNVEKLSGLKSITVVLQNEKGIITNDITALQDEKPILQNEKPIVPDLLQNETTLPEDTEVSTEDISKPILSLPEKLSGDEYAQFIDILKTQLKIQGGMVMDVYHQLRGTGADKKSKRYRYGATFREKPVCLAELRLFVPFYRRQVSDTSIPVPTSADGLENWFGKLRAEQSKPTEPDLHAQWGVTEDDYMLPNLHESPFDLQYPDEQKAG